MDWRRSDGSRSGSRRPILCLVTDRRAARGPLPGAVAAALAGGVDWVQVREKDLSGTQHHWNPARRLAQPHVQLHLFPSAHVAKEEDEGV